MRPTIHLPALADGSRRGQPWQAKRPYVYLAEDDTSFREALVDHLSFEGFDVVEAADGRTLLAALEANLVRPHGRRIDAVICDHRMPQMTGLMALRYLRGWDRAIPFFLITAFCDDGVAATAYAWGATEVLSKPFELDALVAVVKTSL